MKTKYLHILFIVSIGLFIWLYTTMPKIKQEIDMCLKDPVAFEIMLHQNKQNNEIKRVIDHIAFGFVLIFLIGSYILLLKQIKQNNRLNQSRKLFLQSIMHELKTPIAKGRLACEFIDDIDIKNKNIKYYEKIDTLIDSFAKMEKLLNDKYELNKEDFYSDELIEHAIELLLLDDISSHIKLDFQKEFKIKNSDFELLSLAFKNLIDNGIKYSPDSKITIIIKDSKIIFENVGDEKEIKQSNSGMGYGLEITKSIFELHQLELQYNYDKRLRKNIFSIKFPK